MFKRSPALPENRSPTHRISALKINRFSLVIAGPPLGGADMKPRKKFEPSDNPFGARK
jgi:hypothetical protein